MIYHCCDGLRRNATAAHATLNGLDYLEVLDRDLAPGSTVRQKFLLLRFLKKPAAPLTRQNLQLTGGERTLVRIVEAWPAEPLPAVPDIPQEVQDLLGPLPQAERERILLIGADSNGDYSTYRLRLVRSAEDPRVPPGFDPQLAEIAFSFKAECPTDFDCKPVRDCPPEVPEPPDINYLAKDYASFRRLLLDRMRHVAPDWEGSSAADSGVTLAELLAYVGDLLSYQQDAAATEAYFATARRRISLRRHAVLVDYTMHDGCNARAWMQVQVEPDTVNLPRAGTQFLTRAHKDPVVFEPMHDAVLRSAHNRIRLYTWGDRRCCLPKGATSATLRGHFPNLEEGRWLLFEELLGPETGEAADADPRHRQVVRLTRVVHSDPDTNTPLTDPLNGQQVTEIEWAEADALGFALCVSTVTDEQHGSLYVDDVSVARGNLVLADHGATQDATFLGAMPAATLFTTAPPTSERCEAPERVPVPPRFRPALPEAPLTQAGGVLKTIIDGGVRVRRRVAFDPDAAAIEAMRWEMAQVWPEIDLVANLLLVQPRNWEVRRTLLSSSANAEEFVVEVDDVGRARLRFGDDRYGKRPDTGTTFHATYRVGNGTAGNVGEGSLVQIVTTVAGVAAVRNPLPATGGVEPEGAESVRRRAPQAFRRLERAVTTDDYAEVTTRYPGVQEAAARMRWTGSWHTVFVTVDRKATMELPDETRADIEHHIDRYRMAGHDLAIRAPAYVPLELALHVCVKPGWFRDDVRRGILERLGKGLRRDGERGFFHPDNFGFGDAVYLSAIYAAARAVPGVDSIVATVFRRYGTDDVLALDEQRIELHPLEVARLDNDASFPERGKLALDLHGGK